MGQLTPQRRAVVAVASTRLAWRKRGVEGRLHEPKASAHPVVTSKARIPVPM